MIPVNLYFQGIERFLGATQNLEATMMEASAGTAKYEHAFHSLVWRIPRLPKEGQGNWPKLSRSLFDAVLFLLGAYTQQLLVCRLPMGSFDQIPEKFYEYVHVEFTMPATTVSHAVVRSVSVTSENPPEKYVRYVARHELKTEMTISFKETDVLVNSYDLPVATSASSHPTQEAQKPGEEHQKESDVDEDDSE